MASTMLASEERAGVLASTAEEDRAQLRRKQHWEMYWRFNNGRYDGFNVCYVIATGAQFSKNRKVRHFDASDYVSGGKVVRQTNTDTLADGTVKTMSWEYEYPRDMLDNGFCPRVYVPSMRSLQIPSGGTACVNEWFNSYSSTTSKYTDTMELFFHGGGLKTQQRDGREDTNGWPSPLFEEEVPDTNDVHTPSRALPDVSVGNWAATVETMTASLEYLDPVKTTQPLAFNSHVLDPRLLSSDSHANIHCTVLHAPDGFSVFVPEEVPPEPVAAAATATWVLPGGNEVQKITVMYSETGQLAAFSKAVYYRV
eukprot:jgi/Chlat1/6927/Chrsp52S06639